MNGAVRTLLNQTGAFITRRVWEALRLDGAGDDFPVQTIRRVGIERIAAVLGRSERTAAEVERQRCRRT